MSLLLLNVFLALAWSALTGKFEPIDLLFGFVLGYMVLWLVMRFDPTNKYFKQFPRIIEFIVFFIGEIIKANFRLAITILTPKMPLRPAVVALPIDLHQEASIILLANLITLTPGTLSLDISSDRKVLFVHTIWLDDVDTFLQDIKNGYERRVKEMLEQ